jgi:threonine aldolase
VIDLRSDTVTHPTEAMLEAMRRAELGDDGREGDPTIRRLERMAAEICGKEAGLFMPSGTMANLVALLAHTGRAGEVLIEQTSHVIRLEMGGIAAVAGLAYRPLPGRRGAMDIDALAEAITPALLPGRLATALVCMETTHNGAGGTVLALDHMKAVYELARGQGIPVHTDGARLFNAAVALGVPASRIAANTDSVSFCVSKGLSAPVGSLLVGTEALIGRARAFRRMVGGNLRQGGVIAAAGIVALETMIDRLAEDHRTAKRLAQGLARIDPRLVDPEAIETNIVPVDFRATGKRAADWAEALKQEGVWVAPSGPWTLRFVTHRHIDEAAVDHTVAAIAGAWNARLKGAA